MKQILFFLFFALGLYSYSQKKDSLLDKAAKNLEKNVVSSFRKNMKLQALPVVYYTPETQWGFGVAGFFRFKRKHEPDSARYSNVLFSLSVTTIKQIVFGMPFQFWFKNEKYNIYGEPSYQDINLYYYGIGNNNPRSYDEKYFMRFFRATPTFLYKMYEHLYGGFRYNVYCADVYRFDKNGNMANGNTPGLGRGFTSGLGLTFKFDNRDNQFYPMKGFYAEFSALTNNQYLGSQFNFNKYTLNATYNVPIPYLKGTLGVNAYGVITTGNVPFYQMAMLGGEEKLRGIYEGKYRDKTCWVLQTEYRRDLFWRIGFAAFCGVGDVAPRLQDYHYQNVRFAWGGGLRGNIDKKQHLNLRLDVGTCEGIINYYFTIGEAF
ncbi:MAG: BamA/TamA family outer membrane protein [Bacteroidetes bacterium]|nr:BamA/TamA family outer membrane protein [Bacteroidota bacterium]